MKLQIKRLHPNAILPIRAYPTDSGLDLAACLDEPVVIPPAITKKLDKPYIKTWDYVTEIETELIEYSTTAGKQLIPTGIAIELPEAKYTNWMTGTSFDKVVYEAVIRPRSGLANKHFISCHLGTIDQQYRGQIFVNMYNYSDKPFVVEHGMKIAQLVINPIIIPDKVVEVTDLSETDRGNSGHGSTGVK